MAKIKKWNNFESRKRMLKSINVSLYYYYNFMHFFFSRSFFVFFLSGCDCSSVYEIDCQKMEIEMNMHIANETVKI